MAKLANIVTIEVKPGNADAVVAALLAHQERSLDEPGTLQFVVLRPRGDDSRLITYEVYRDEAAFDAHRAAPSLAQLLSDTREMVLGFSGTRCDLVD